MAPRYSDPSEYGGTDDGSYRTPFGQSRNLNTGERASLLRRAGIADNAVADRAYPEEYGERLA